MGGGRVGRCVKVRQLWFEKKRAEHRRLCLHLYRCSFVLLTISSHFPGRCSLPLGLEDKRLVDGALSASTYYNHHLAPWLGRLNSIRSWSARVNNARQWLQINLGNLARVTGIATQGRRDAHQWVTRYVLSYGDGTNFKAYRERRKIRVRTPRESGGLLVK